MGIEINAGKKKNPGVKRPGFQASIEINAGKKKIQVLKGQFPGWVYMFQIFESLSACLFSLLPQILTHLQNSA